MKRAARWAGWLCLWLLLVVYFTYLRFPYVRLRPAIEPRIAALGLGKISFDDIHATPFGGVRLSGVSLLPTGMSGKPIQMDDLSLSPALWRFIRGGRGAHFDARMAGGHARGTAGITRDAHTQLAATMSDVDLTKVDLPGLPDGLEGKLEGTVNLDFEHVALDGAKGTVHLGAAHGSIPPITAAGFKATPAPIHFDSAALDATLDGPKIEITSIKLAGPDLEGSASGTLTVRGRSLATSELNSDLRFRLPEGSSVKAVEGLISAVRVKKDAEGYFVLKLGGTLMNPRPRT